MKVRITSVSIGGVPCPIQQFDVDLDKDIVFVETDFYGNPGQRIKIDLQTVLQKAPVCCSTPGECGKCGDSAGRRAPS